MTIVQETCIIVLKVQGCCTKFLRRIKMKNKSKKILAGLGIGLALTSATMLTGCTSDITFNQKDLDNAIENVNSYLTNKQNNDSEYVRNTLNELLINGMNNSIGVKNISYYGTTEHYYYGIKDDSYKITYKRNVSDNLVKIYNCNEAPNNSRIDYVEMTQTTLEGSTTYNVDSYLKDWDGTKTHKKTDNITNVSSLIPDVDYSDYVGLYSSIIATLNYKEGLVWNDFVKSTDNGIVTYKCSAVNPEYAGSSSIVCSMVLKFKDNKIIQMDSVSAGFENQVQYNECYSKNTMVFDYENETIEFDKTGFTTVTE